MEKVKFNVVYNRKRKLLSNGTALIQIEAYLKGKKRYFSTGIYVSPDQWDKKNKRVKNHSNKLGLNVKIKNLIDKMEDVELTQHLNKRPFSLEYLTEYMKGNRNDSFIEFCNNEILNLKITASTRSNHLSSFAHLKKFRKSIKFGDLDHSFIINFQNYLREKGLNESSVSKNLAVLRRYVNLAIDNGMIDISRYPFRKFRIKQPKTKKVFLTPEEVEKIEALELPEGFKHLQLTLDKFRFSIYTGLRYSDVSALKPGNIVPMDGNEWLVIDMQKTQEQLRIPIYTLFGGKAVDIFYKYAGSNKVTLFDFQYNNMMNIELKTIAALAGINKRISFHTARHTQATYLLYKGVSMPTIQKLLGHKRLETTQIYSKVMDMTMLNELSKINYSK